MSARVSAHQFTLRQLQIFWTVAQTRSLTRAAKQLDVRQPSISQQLSRMEHAVGGKLIRYANTELRLTPAGEYLLAEAGAILSAVDRASAGLGAFFDGARGQLVVGALPSLARNLLVPAYAYLRERHPGYALDIVEVTPREAREQLVGRILDAALASDFADVQITDLRATSLARDSQVLAVPRALPDLSDIADPARGLSPEHLAVLRNTVRFAFGSEHTARVNAWYEALIPRAEAAVRCRSYEAALAFVEAGLGTALVPELALRQRSRLLFDVALYAVPLPQRQTVLLMPAQSARLPGLVALETALGVAAAALVPLAARREPRFMRRGVAAGGEGGQRLAPPERLAAGEGSA